MISSPIRSLICKAIIVYPRVRSQTRITRRRLVRIVHARCITERLSLPLQRSISAAPWKFLFSWRPVSNPRPLDCLRRSIIRHSSPDARRGGRGVFAPAAAQDLFRPITITLGVGSRNHCTSVFQKCLFTDQFQFSYQRRWCSAVRLRMPRRLTPRSDLPVTRRL